MDDPARLKLAVHRYAAARTELTGVQDAARRASDALGSIKMKDRWHLATMVRRLYGTSRKVPRENWLEAFAVVTGRYIRDGIDEESLLAALRAVWRKLVTNPTEENLKRLTGLARAAGKPIEEGKRMPNAEADRNQPRMNTDKHGPGAESYHKATKSTKRVSGVKRGASGVKRNASSVKRPASIADMEKPTALETFSRNRAREQLRLSLADCDPIVKKCVVMRLLRLESFEDLARKLKLPVEDVGEILTRMRGLVRQYTTYFDRDWYWDETAKRFTLPEAG